MPSRQTQLHEWLRQVAQSDAVQLQAMSNDASFRQYFRARWRGKSYVVMDAPPSKETLAPFMDVAQRLTEAGLNAPRIVARNIQAGFLLLTDLGDDLYLPALLQADAQSVERLYDDALSALVIMQKRVSCANLPRYDATLLQQEMDLFPDWLLEEHLHVRLSTAERSMLQSCFEQLVEMALAQPQVFVHRDYHSRNLLIHAHNPAIIDFQDAVCGALTYDLVSLLRDAYVVWQREKVEAWALDYQQRALHMELTEQQDRRVFLRWFDWMGLQRHIKVAGIFARLRHRDGKPAYLADIPRVLHYIIEVARGYTQMQALQHFVQQRVVPAMQREKAAFVRQK